MKYWANVDGAPHKVFLGLRVFMLVRIIQRPLRRGDIDICKIAKYIEIILIFLLVSTRLILITFGMRFPWFKKF